MVEGADGGMERGISGYLGALGEALSLLLLLQLASAVFLL